MDSTRYGVMIDTYMRDHVLVLFRFFLKAVVKEACGFIVEAEERGLGSRTFECPVLVRVLSWLASHLGVLYGEGSGKAFAIEMFKQCLVESASQIILFQSDRSRSKSSGVLEDLGDGSLSNKDVEMENNSGGEVAKSLDSAQVISVSRVAAAVAALYERSVLEGKIRAIMLG